MAIFDGKDFIGIDDACFGDGSGTQPQFLDSAQEAAIRRNNIYLADAVDVCTFAPRTLQNNQDSKDNDRAYASLVWATIAPPFPVYIDQHTTNVKLDFFYRVGDESTATEDYELRAELIGYFSDGTAASFGSVDVTASNTEGSSPEFQPIELDIELYPKTQVPRVVFLRIWGKSRRSLSTGKSRDTGVRFSSGAIADVSATVYGVWDTYGPTDDRYELQCTEITDSDFGGMGFYDHVAYGTAMYTHPPSPHLDNTTDTATIETFHLSYIQYRSMTVRVIRSTAERFPIELIKPKTGETSLSGPKHRRILNDIWATPRLVGMGPNGLYDTDRFNEGSEGGNILQPGIVWPWVYGTDTSYYELDSVSVFPGAEDAYYDVRMFVFAAHLATIHPYNDKNNRDSRTIRELSATAAWDIRVKMTQLSNADTGHAAASDEWTAAIESYPMTHWFTAPVGEPVLLKQWAHYLEYTRKNIVTDDPQDTGMSGMLLDDDFSFLNLVTVRVKAEDMSNGVPFKLAIEARRDTGVTPTYAATYNGEDDPEHLTLALMGYTVHEVRI